MSNLKCKKCISYALCKSLMTNIPWHTHPKTQVFIKLSTRCSYIHNYISVEETSLGFKYSPDRMIDVLNLFEVEWSAK